MTTPIDLVLAAAERWLYEDATGWSPSHTELEAAIAALRELSQVWLLTTGEFPDDRALHGVLTSQADAETWRVQVLAADGLADPEIASHPLDSPALLHAIRTARPSWTVHFEHDGTTLGFVRFSPSPVPDAMHVPRGVWEGWTVTLQAATATEAETRARRLVAAWRAANHPS